MEIERDPYAPTPPPGEDQLPSDDGERERADRAEARLARLDAELGRRRR